MLPSANSLEGKHVPKVTFKTRAGDQWKDVTTATVFKGRTVLVFCLPGACKLIGSADDLEAYFDARKAA